MHKPTCMRLLPATMTKCFGLHDRRCQFARELHKVYLSTSRFGYQTAATLSSVEDGEKHEHHALVNDAGCSTDENLSSLNSAGVIESESFYRRQTRMRNTALSSLIVQGASVNHRHHLYNICKQYAGINGMYHYGRNQKNFTIIETASPEDAWNLVQQSSFANQADVVPCRSRLLSANSGLSKTKLDDSASQPDFSYASDYTYSEQELLKRLREASNLSDQTQILYDLSTLSPIGERLRFFVASQIEDGMRGFFRNCRAYLFGSSVNGFGKHGCDLDVMLELDEFHSAQLRGLNSRNNRKASAAEASQNPAGGGIWSLSLQSKYAPGNERVQLQRNLEMMADFMKVWMPSFSHIQRILPARVPIVKFDHDVAGVSGDLCLSNGSGVEMSEILYAYGEMDCRLRPLVFLVRMWARSAQLTNPYKIPGRWLTNFHLSILCVYYMQTRKLLPSLQELAAERNDLELVPNIKRQVTQASLAASDGSNVENLEVLVKNFFIWCATFDFRHMGFSIIDARQFSKPDFSAFYAQNPVEPELNISRNVSVEELDKFQSAARSVAWHFENSRDQAGKAWSILNLISPTTSLAAAGDGTGDKMSVSSGRLDLRNLFAADESGDSKTSQAAETLHANRNNNPRHYSVEVRAVPPAASSFGFRRTERPPMPPPAAMRMEWPASKPQQQQRQPRQQEQQKQQPQQPKKYEQRLGRAASTIMPVKRKW